MVTALNSLTGTNKAELQKKLEKMVLEKLRLDEAKDAEEMNENTEEVKESGEENGNGKKGKKAKSRKR